jgi:hypothetical protein
VATFDKNGEDGHQKGITQRQKRTKDGHHTEDGQYSPEDGHHHIEDDHHHIQLVTFDRIKENQLVTNQVAEDGHAGHEGPGDSWGLDE